MTQKDKINLSFYIVLAIFTILLWVFVRNLYFAPAAYGLIEDFKTEVLLPADKVLDEVRAKKGKPDKVKVKVTEKKVTVAIPGKKSAPSKQTKANGRREKVLQQCSNISVSCLQSVERMVRDEQSSGRK